jgi:HPt (histidine-containing phosphotransfer) domain-containing protein
LPSAIAGAIDLSALAQLQKDYDDQDGSMLAGLVEAFAEESRVMLRMTRENPGDELESVRKAAHRLKSAAATLGATQVAAMCRQLEAAARSGDVEQSNELLRTLPSAIIRARAVLARVVAGGQSKAT